MILLNKFISHMNVHSHYVGKYKIISRNDKNIRASYVTKHNFNDSEYTKHKVSIQIKGKKLSKFYDQQYNERWYNDQDDRLYNEIFKIYLVNSKCILHVNYFNNRHKDKISIILKTYYASDCITTCSKSDIRDAIKFYKEILARKNKLNDKDIREIVHI